MPRKKKEQTKKESNTEILIGFVNSFQFEDKAAARALAGHPKEGRLYQIIKDNHYGYRLHIGAENNPAGMEGILLGPELSGDHEGKWKFDVAIVTKDNFLTFNIADDDAIKLGEWLDTNNKDLNAVLEKTVALATSDEDGNIIEMVTPAQAMHDMMEKFHEENEKEMKEFSDSLNLISMKDPQFFRCIVELITYLGTTYGDKYEAGSRPNFGKEFLLSSTSSDVAVFNSVKYLQRYCTTGFEKSQNVKDLYKAVHYILFELQRKRRHE